MSQENTPCRVHKRSILQVIKHGKRLKIHTILISHVFIRIFKQKTQKLSKRSSFGRDAEPLSDPTSFFRQKVIDRKLDQ